MNVFVNCSDEDVQLAAIAVNWRIIQFIDQPTIAVQIAAIRQSPDAVSVINNISLEAILSC